MEWFILRIGTSSIGLEDSIAFPNGQTNNEICGLGGGSQMGL